MLINVLIKKVVLINVLIIKKVIVFFCCFLYKSCCAGRGWQRTHNKMTPAAEPRKKKKNTIFNIKLFWLYISNRWSEFHARTFWSSLLFVVSPCGAVSSSSLRRFFKIYLISLSIFILLLNATTTIKLWSTLVIPISTTQLNLLSIFYLWNDMTIS